MLNKRIKALRLKKNLTQKELANKLNLTPKMVSFYELGERVPPTDALEKLADIFGVTTDYLLCRTGFITCPVCYNTRPIVLYTCGSNGTPLSLPISKNPSEVTTSSICRVEKLDGCCATCRVLTYDTATSSYTATNSFFTINLNCVCCIRCLDDTYVDLCN